MGPPSSLAGTMKASGNWARCSTYVPVVPEEKLLTSAVNVPLLVAVKSSSASTPLADVFNNTPFGPYKFRSPSKPTVPSRSTMLSPALAVNDHRSRSPKVIVPALLPPFVMGPPSSLAGTMKASGNWARCSTYVPVVPEEKLLTSAVNVPLLVAVKSSSASTPLAAVFNNTPFGPYKFRSPSKPTVPSRSTMLSPALAVNDHRSRSPKVIVPAKLPPFVMGPPSSLAGTMKASGNWARCSTYVPVVPEEKLLTSAVNVPLLVAVKSSSASTPLAAVFNNTPFGPYKFRSPSKPTVPSRSTMLSPALAVNDHRSRSPKVIVPAKLPPFVMGP